jgi:hypothetical protein
MDDQLDSDQGGERRYTRAELDDAERDMAALVREFIRNPDYGHLTREISAILDNCDLQAVTLACLGAVRGMMLQHADMIRQLAEGIGNQDLADRIGRDPGAYIDSVLAGLQADYRAKEAEGGDS